MTNLPPEPAPLTGAAEVRECKTREASRTLPRASASSGTAEVQEPQASPPPSPHHLRVLPKYGNSEERPGSQVSARSLRLCKHRRKPETHIPSRPPIPQQISHCMRQAHQPSLGKRWKTSGRYFIKDTFSDCPNTAKIHPSATPRHPTRPSAADINCRT